jgi:hypothetical protein
VGREEASVPENSPSTKARLTQGVMVVAGMAAGGVVVGVTGDLVFNSESSYAAIVLLATAVVVAAAAGLWRTGYRQWRAFVVGMVVIWVVFMVLLGVPWMFMDPDSGPGR